MPYTETGKEKEKRESYMKANKERGIRAEKDREYKMFGTTEQNIPAVDTMGSVTGMKKGGMLKPVDKNSNPGLSKLPTEVRNKMGYMKIGGKVKSASSRADGCCIKGKTKA
jgi:hypothetical protein